MQVTGHIRGRPCQQQPSSDRWSVGPGSHGTTSLTDLKQSWCTFVGAALVDLNRTATSATPHLQYRCRFSWIGVSHRP